MTAERGHAQGEPVPFDTSVAHVARVYDYWLGLELVEPGLVRAQLWRPDSEFTAASPAALWGGVARKR